MGSAVDSSIGRATDTVTNAVDINIVTPIMNAKESITSAVDDAVKGATGSVINDVDANIDAPINTANDSVASERRPPNALRDIVLLQGEKGHQTSAIKK